MQVDFYLIQDEHPDALRRVAARLLEKAYAKNLRAWVVCANQADAEALDDWLWTYRADSFLPHCLASTIPEGLNPPIQISTDTAAAQESAFDLLFNLSETMLDNIQTFQRVLELVAPHQKTAGRTRYKAYQQQNMTLKHHQV
jgi:DNA polymerase III subunit chi